MNVNKKNDKVAIILAFYNGHDFIEELLESLNKQTFQNFDIFIFDDCSSTPFNIKEIKVNDSLKSKIIVSRNIENLGYTKNFLLGLSKVPDKYLYYCFCDQDDIWLPHKLKRGIRFLNEKSNGHAGLYGTKTAITDSLCKEIIFYSIKILRDLSFQNSLLQNFAGGNTMMFNKLGKEIIINSLKEDYPASHDWWSYIIITGSGGNAIYDEKISLLYRQHNNTTMGSNKTWKQRFKRLIQINNDVYKKYIEMNNNLLLKNYHFLTKKNKLIFNDFQKSRKSNLFNRVLFLIKSGVYRQNHIGNIIVFFCIIFKKI